MSDFWDIFHPQWGSSCQQSWPLIPACTEHKIVHPKEVMLHSAIYIYLSEYLGATIGQKAGLRGYHDGITAGWANRRQASGALCGHPMQL